MCSRTLVHLILFTAIPASSWAQESRQVLQGLVIDPVQETRRGPETGFFRWGFTAELGASIPVGDRSYAVENRREFISAFDVGFDLSFDVSRFFQASFVMRFGFGGVDRDLYTEAIKGFLGYLPPTVGSTLIQSGSRIRFFLFEAHHFRPYLTLECSFTSMGVTARQEVAAADGDTERVTVLAYRYRAVSVTPGAGLRYDVGLRARPGLPRFSRLLSLYIQATYSFNFWRDVVLELEDVRMGEESIKGLNLSHVRVMAGVGVMF